VVAILGFLRDGIPSALISSPISKVFNFCATAAKVTFFI